MTDESDFDDAVRSGSRIARWRGLVGLAVRRIFGRLVSDLPNRTALTVSIVAITVALLVVVTGLSFGLATDSTVYGSSVDYWVVPESGTTQTTVFSAESAQLGDVHARQSQLRGVAGVTSSTPVLVELVRMRGEDSPEPEYVLAVGVVPSERNAAIAGVSTGALSPGDPYYANGSYDGEFTGEVVLSPGAAEVLDASESDSLSVLGLSTGRVERQFSVTAVNGTGEQTPQGEVPVAVFHLSELQTLTGADDGDLADQFLVETDDPSAKAGIQAVYPEASVVARSGLATRNLFDSDLPLAVSAAALVIALVVSTLFLATTMALEIDADRHRYAVLESLGFSTPMRLALVAVSTLTVAVVGGLLGCLLGGVGIVVLNRLVLAQTGIDSLALFPPVLPVYAMLVAVVVGVVATPYPLVVAWRSNSVTEVLQ